jgi:hypothetical protein
MSADQDGGVDIYTELKGLVEALELQAIPYALCGGLALAFHGHPRFTKDIDILIDPADLDRVSVLARTRGFSVAGGRLRLGAGERMVELFRISKVEGTDVLTLDLLLANRVMAGVWNGRESFAWNGRTVWVVSAAGLADMKRLAGRDQDLVDLKLLESKTHEPPQPA